MQPTVFPSFFSIGAAAALVFATACSKAAENPEAVKTEPKAVELIDSGEPSGVIVVPSEADPVTELAAEEIANHVERATGARLPVVAESEAGKLEGGRIYLGATEAVARLGIEHGELAADEFVMRTSDGDLYIAGKGDGEAFNPYSGRNGTLHGAYAFLDRYLGVRWLWPGELGTHVPERENLRVPATEMKEKPAIGYRRYRHSFHRISDDPRIARLAFSQEGFEAYDRALNTFLRRHRLGGSEPKPKVGHRFGDWWNRYGDEHPEWFAMNDEGERVGPTMCVSNRELQRFIVEERWNGWSNISLGEADHNRYCHCEDCMAWDKPLPEDWNNEANRVTSNRYARFAKAVRDLALERKPEGDFLVTMFLYKSYTHAPTIDIDLSGVYGEFVPWGHGFTAWYPMPEQDHELFKETWNGWAETGMRMGYRPNYLYGGYAMPHLSTRQTGDMFRHAYANGMTTFDFDSLLAHWAVEGPMLYLHMRLPADPTRTVDEILAEYYEAFGPAGDAVKAYFEYWETYSAEEVPQGGTGYFKAWMAGMLYPQSAFERGFELLERAHEVAKSPENSEYAERVEFLRIGLEHARMAAEFTGLLEHNGRLPQTKHRFEAARKALKSLVDFRREHEDLFFSDFVAASRSENRSIDIDALLEGEFKGSETAEDGDWRAPWRDWFFRKDPDTNGDEEDWHEPDYARTDKGIFAYDAGDEEAFEIDRDLWTEVEVPAHLDYQVGSYLGVGWYATVFNGPAEWKDEAVEFRFESVDEQAVVFLNGEKIGTHTVESEGRPVGELWDRPFSVRAPANVFRAGEPNLLVVRVEASKNQMGIWGPVRMREAPERPEPGPSAHIDFSEAEAWEKVTVEGRVSKDRATGLAHLSGTTRGGSSVMAKTRAGPGRYTAHFTVGEPSGFEWHMNEVRLFVPDLEKPHEGGFSIVWTPGGLIRAGVPGEGVLPTANVLAQQGGSYELGDIVRMEIGVPADGSDIRIRFHTPENGEPEEMTLRADGVFREGYFGVANRKWHSDFFVRGINYQPADG